MARPSKPQLLRDKALGYLAQREYSYQELKRKLHAYVTRLDAHAVKATHSVDSNGDNAFEGHGEATDSAVPSEEMHALNAELIESVLQDFKQHGWLSEQRFTEQMVHARKAKFGSMRIAHELREKGISETLVEQAMQSVKADEAANARAICRRKYHGPPGNREEWAKQARFLQSRGFGFDVIKRALMQDEQDDMQQDDV